MNEQNISQAKFLIKELLALLDIIPEKEYDTDLEILLEELRNEITVVTND